MTIYRRSIVTIYLASFLRCSVLSVQNRNCPHPSFIQIPTEDKVFTSSLWCRKTRMIGLPDGQKVLRQIWPFRYNIGVWQTDRYTPHDGVDRTMQICKNIYFDTTVTLKLELRLPRSAHLRHFSDLALYKYT